MADRTGQELEQAGRDALQTGRTVASAAAKAVGGDMTGAAITVLTDEGTRRTILITAVLLISFVSAILVFVLYLFPMAVYEVTAETLAKADEEFWAGFYGSDTPGWKGIAEGVAKGTVGWVKTAWQGVRDLVGLLFGGDMTGTLRAVNEGRSAEITVATEITSPSASLADKMDLAGEKYESRVAEIEKCILESSGEWLDRKAKELFLRDYTEGWDIYAPDAKGGLHSDNFLIPACVVRQLTDRQKLRFAALYDVMNDNEFGTSEIADYLKWLGYARSPGDTLVLNLLDTPVPISGWIGNYLPQYLLDEAKTRAELETAALLERKGVPVSETAVDRHLEELEQELEELQRQLQEEREKTEEDRNMGTVEYLEQLIRTTEEETQEYRKGGKESIQKIQTETERECRIKVLNDYRRRYGVSAIDLNIYAYAGTVSSVPLRGENRDGRNLMKVRKSGEVVATDGKWNVIYQPVGEMKQYYQDHGENGNYTYFGWKYDTDGTPLYEHFRTSYFPNYTIGGGEEETDSAEGCIIAKEVSVQRRIVTTVQRPVRVVYSSRYGKTVDGSRYNPYWGNDEAEEKFIRVCEANGWSYYWGPSDVSAWSTGTYGERTYHSFLFHIDWQTEVTVPATLVMAKMYKYYYVVSYTCPYYISIRPESEMLELAGILEGDHRDRYLETAGKIGKALTGTEGS